MLGTDILVAPVMSRGCQRNRVYLPAGDGSTCGLGLGRFTVPNVEHFTVPAPIGAPPVFYRADWTEAESVRAMLEQSGDLATVSTQPKFSPGCNRR